MVSESHPVPEWLRTLSGGGGHFSAILRESEQDSVDGYRHTIREICQQPATWLETARRMQGFRAQIEQSLKGCERIVLTGSGSSQYAGECVAPALRKDLRLPVDVQGGGRVTAGRQRFGGGRAHAGGFLSAVWRESGECGGGPATARNGAAYESSDTHL